MPDANGSADQSSPVDPKHFVLDTNVLLHNPNAMFMFDDNRVVIPFTVIEEIDTFKKQNDDVGRNAREAIRHLDRLRDTGKLSEGVAWNGHGGLVQVDLDEHELPPSLHDASPDNRIIACAYQSHRAGHRTIFISKDINARIKERHARHRNPGLRGAEGRRGLGSTAATATLDRARPRSSIRVVRREASCRSPASTRVPARTATSPEGEDDTPLRAPRESVRTPARHASATSRTPASPAGSP